MEPYHRDHQELKPILAKLSELGFTIEEEHKQALDDATFECVYVCELKIPGEDVFVGESMDGEIEAYRVAAEELKKYYEEHFGDKMVANDDVDGDGGQRMKTHSLTDSTENGSLASSRNGCGSTGNLSAVSRVSQQSVKIKPTKKSVNTVSVKHSPGSLGQQSRLVIDLVNIFNSVYATGKSPDEIMNDIVALKPDAFTFTTIKKGIKGPYQTTAKLYNLAEFDGFNHGPAKAKSNALHKHFGPLRDFAKFFAIFKWVHSPGKSPRAILEELIARNHPDFIQLNIHEPSGRFVNFKMSVVIQNLLNLAQIAPREDICYSNLAEKTVAQLKLLSASVRGSDDLFADVLRNQSLTLSRERSAVKQFNLNNLKQLKVPPAQPVKLRRPMSPKKNEVTSQKVSSTAQNLNSRDIRLIQLLNLFNAVYDLEKEPNEIMDALLVHDPACFQMNTKKNTKDDLYLTTVNNADMGMFFSLAQSEAESQDEGILQVFECLYKLDKLFVDFANLYSPNESPLELIPQLIAMNPRMISFQVWPRQHSGFQASLVIEHLHYFNETADAQEKAILTVFGKVCDYLRIFFDKIERKIPPAKIPHILDAGDEDAEESKEDREVYKKNVERIDLVNQFISVYGPKKTPVEVMNDLIDACPTLIEITKEKVGNSIFKTTLRLKKIQEVFLGNDVSWAESREKAMKKAYVRLNNLAFLFKIFRSIYHPTKEATKILDEIHRQHPKLIRYETHAKKVAGEMLYTAQVEILNFSTIKETDDNQGLARNVAMQKAVTYLKTLSGWIRDSPNAISYIQ